MGLRLSYLTTSKYILIQLDRYSTQNSCNVTNFSDIVFEDRMIGDKILKSHTFTLYISINKYISTSRINHIFDETFPTGSLTQFYQQTDLH